MPKMQWERYSNPPIISDFFLSDLGAQSSKQLSDLGAKEKGITYMVFFNPTVTVTLTNKPLWSLKN